MAISISCCLRKGLNLAKDCSWKKLVHHRADLFVKSQLIFKQKTEIPDHTDAVRRQTSNIELRGSHFPSGSKQNNFRCVFI